MASGNCMMLMLSWILFGVGFYVYENEGLAISFIPFAVAAAIRGDRDKIIGEKLKTQKSWQVLFLLYLLVILLIAIIYMDKISSLSGTGKALAFLFPLVLMAVFNDLKTCGNRSLL